MAWSLLTHLLQACNRNNPVPEHDSHDLPASHEVDAIMTRFRSMMATLPPNTLVVCVVEGLLDGHKRHLDSEDRAVTAVIKDLIESGTVDISSGPRVKLILSFPASIA